MTTPINNDENLPTADNNTPVEAQLVATERIIVQQETTLFGRFGKFLIAALIFCIMCIIGQQIAYESYFQAPGEIEEKYFAFSKEAKSKIAILSIEGVIIKSDGFVKRQIDKIAKDPDIRAIVLRIDSPGGTVNASDYIYHHIKKLRKKLNIPVVVSMGNIAASGGYYAAMAAGDQKDIIFAEPTTWTGSIGVIIPHYDISELLTKWDVKNDSITSGKFKQMGSPTQKLDDKQRAEERKVLQAIVDDSFSGFKNVVLKGRPALADDPEKLKEATTGQVFTAQQALALGLVDRIGFIEEAIERAAELANISATDVRVVKYTQSPTVIDALTSMQAKNQQLPLNLNQLLDLTVPRAYYLNTWLPAALTNSTSQ